jgi:hypothetical protein
MSEITPEFAVESLWQALAWAPVELDPIFDAVAHRLRHRFAGMTIGEIDLILADARREAQHDVDELEWKIVRAFKDALGLDDEIAA